MNPLQFVLVPHRKGKALPGMLLVEASVISPETEESKRMAHDTQLQAALNHLMHVDNFNFQQQEQQQSMDRMNHMFADPATRNQVIPPVQQLPLGNSMNIGETQQTPR
jgi:hypothetical protein